MKSALVDVSHRGQIMAFQSVWKLTLCELTLIIGKQGIGRSQMNKLSLFPFFYRLYLGTFSLNIMSRDNSRGWVTRYGCFVVHHDETNIIMHHLGLLPIFLLLAISSISLPWHGTPKSKHQYLIFASGFDR